MKRFIVILLLPVQLAFSALPTLRGVSSGIARSTTSITPNSAVVAGIADGDLEIMVATTELGQTISITANGGTAWTAISGTPVSGTTTTGEVLYIWWRIRQSGDSTPTVAPSADHVFVYFLAIVAGTFDSSSPIEIPNTGSHNVNNTSYSYAPGTSTTGPDRFIISAATSPFDGTTLQVTAATNANLANVANTAYNNGSEGAGGGVNSCYGELATAGSVGTFAATWSGAARKNYASFAVKPTTAVVDSSKGFFLLYP